MSAQEERELDELQGEQPETAAAPAPDAAPATSGESRSVVRHTAETPVKRSRGRPKGSKNKKTLEAEKRAAETGVQTTERRKRGRPPKAKDEAAAAAATTDKPAPRTRGRPPKKKPEDEAAAPAAPAAEANDAEGDDDDGTVESAAKRPRVEPA
ncbi:hypothetical protein SISNIDRAFT_545888 [Sistotremastrum niveocremeum HHB9708]|uniref:Uncharacterized protein n=2 Tax=Sistotremastraceae TaxID=3402574 RepID=A0A165AIJ9_9AGAM|nr:hypothetical protein SISNIDRAFT_545888 [Sistotremastrum niveocremeum HHB9708]KZT44057.1 hypothetical protein SISSUDRAFT_1057061 [Sistotremastrum suecicum HHB10207 ss-3]